MRNFCFYIWQIQNYTNLRFHSNIEIAGNSARSSFLICGSNPPSPHSKMHNLKTQSIPAWYRLGNPGNGTLTLQVHEDAYEFVRAKELARTPIVQDLRKKYGLPEFVGPNLSEFGFGDVLQVTAPSTPRWLSWQFSLPKLITPQQTSLNNKTLLSLRATLRVLFLALSLFEGKSDADADQLLSIDSFSLPELGCHGGGGMSVVFSQQAAAWLANPANEFRFSELRSVMMDAERYIYGSGFSRDISRYAANIVDGQFPDIRFVGTGNASGLHLRDARGVQPNKGFHMFTNNVDSGVMQLVLLAAIARLHQLMREHP